MRYKLTSEQMLTDTEARRHLLSASSMSACLMHPAVPMSATGCFPLQLLLCGTVFHLTLTAAPSLSIFCCLFSHLTFLSHFLTSLICILPTQWLVIFDNVIVITCRHTTVSYVMVAILCHQWSASNGECVQWGSQMSWSQWEGHYIVYVANRL